MSHSVYNSLLDASFYVVCESLNDFSQSKSEINENIFKPNRINTIRIIINRFNGYCKSINAHYTVNSV